MTSDDTIAARYEEIVRWDNYVTAFVAERVVLLQVLTAGSGSTAASEARNVVGLIWSPKLIIVLASALTPSPNGSVVLSALPEVRLKGQVCRSLWADAIFVGMAPEEAIDLQVDTPAVNEDVLPPDYAVEMHPIFEATVTTEREVWYMYGDLPEGRGVPHGVCRVFMPIYDDGAEYLGLPVFSQRRHLIGITFDYDDAEKAVPTFGCAFPQLALNPHYDTSSSAEVPIE